MPVMPVLTEWLRRLKESQGRRSWASGAPQRLGLAALLAAVSSACVNPLLAAAWLALAAFNELALRPWVFDRFVEPLIGVNRARARTVGSAMALLTGVLWLALVLGVWLSGKPVSAPLAAILAAAVIVHVVIVFPRDRLIGIGALVGFLLAIPFFSLGLTIEALILALGAGVFLISIAMSAAARDRLVEMLRERSAARRLAEAASVEKSQFMANMSHELRTPLNAIIGYTEILIEDAEPSLHPDLQRVHSAAQHLLKLVGQVLDLTLIDSGQVEMWIDALEVESIVNDVVQAQEQAPNKNGNRLVASFGHGDGLASADAVRLRQCLAELLANAFQFTEDGVVTVTTAATSSAIQFAVSDTGIGIAPEQIELLFKPFGQLDNASTRRCDGMGLGLALTKRLAQLMGGDVSVKSTLGVGSTFTLSAPRCAASVSPSADMAPVGPAGGLRAADALARTELA